MLLADLTSVFFTFFPSFRLRSVASAVCGTENHWRSMVAEWPSPCWPFCVISWEGSLSFRSGCQRRERELCARMRRQPLRAPWHPALHPGRLQRVERLQHRLEQHPRHPWPVLLKSRLILRPVGSLKSTRRNSLRYVEKPPDVLCVFVLPFVTFYVHVDWHKRNAYVFLFVNLFCPDSNLCSQILVSSFKDASHFCSQIW